MDMTTQKQAELTEQQELEKKLLDNPTFFEYADDLENNDYGGITYICGEHPTFPTGGLGTKFKRAYAHLYHFDKKGRRQEFTTIVLINDRPYKLITTKRHIVKRVADVMFPF